MLTVAELGRSVTYGWGAYWGGRYGLLAALLPDLLAQSRAVLRDCALVDRARAIDLAAQVQQLTAGTLLRLGAADLAHTAARESLRLAAGGEDPLRDAAMRSTLTYVLIRQGRFVDAERVAAATAAEIQPAGNASTAQLSVYGGLLLRGATAAARGDRAGAASAVVIEDYAAAAEVARRMPRNSVLPLAARSRHLADVAHAQLRLGRDQAAESALLTMEQSAPGWTAHHACRGCSSANC